MSARESEQQLVARCIQVAVASGDPPRSQREANVFALAGMLIRSTHPEESRLLTQSAKLYFVDNPQDKVDTADILHRGWVIGLPRLRDALSRELNRRESA